MTHGSVGLLGLLRSVFLAQGPSETLKRSCAIQQEREKVTRIHVLILVKKKRMLFDHSCYRRRASATRYPSHRTFMCNTAARIG